MAIPHWKVSHTDVNCDAWVVKFVCFGCDMNGGKFVCGWSTRNIPITSGSHDMELFEQPFPSIVGASCRKLNYGLGYWSVHSVFPYQSCKTFWCKFHLRIYEANLREISGQYQFHPTSCLTSIPRKIHSWEPHTPEMGYLFWVIVYKMLHRQTTQFLLHNIFN